MLIKQCARPGCVGIIQERWPSQLRRRTYCSRRCTQWAGTQTRLRGTADVRRIAKQIQRAVGITGEPSRQLIQAVQRCRQNAYRAGWTCVMRKFRRAIKRGQLVPMRLAS